MPEVYKILGQSAITTAVANVYTVPANTQAVISSIVVANRSSSNVNVVNSESSEPTRSLL